MSGEVYPTVPLIQLDSQGKPYVPHVWQRFFQGQWRKTGQASDNAPITAENIYGILASLNINPNGQLNTTNFCTVDSTDNGTSATIRVYGSGGVGTTWTRKVGSTTFGPYPAMIQAGAAYNTDYYVMFDSGPSLFHISTSFSDSLPDNYIYCGKVHTVNSGGGGGSPGGGGPGGGPGGTCFTGNTKTILASGDLTFEEAGEYETVFTKKGWFPARKHTFNYKGKLINMGGMEGVTPGHLFDDGDCWRRAELFLTGRPRFEFEGQVYTWEVLTNDDDARNFKLANGHFVHNMSAT